MKIVSAEDFPSQVAYGEKAGYLNKLLRRNCGSTAHRASLPRHSKVHDIHGLPPSLGLASLIEVLFGYLHTLFTLPLESIILFLL